MYETFCSFFPFQKKMSTIKKIDKDSAEGVDNRLSIFSIPATNVGILRSQYKELLPLNALNQSGGPFIFRLFAEGLYVDLSKIFIQISMRIERKDAGTGDWVPLSKGDTEALEGDRHVSVIQYLGLTWIRRLTMAINGVQCYDSQMLYAYRALILHDLSSTAEVNKGIYEAGLYVDDGLNKNYYDGIGFKQRAVRFQAGKQCKTLAHLDFDLARQDQLLIPHSDIVWTIYKNSDEFLLMTPAYQKTMGLPAVAKGDPVPPPVYVKNETPYRLKLDDLRLFVKQVDLSASLNNAIARHLESSPAKYAFKKVEMRNVFLGKGRQEVTHPVFTSSCPRRLIVCFVKSEAFNGDRTLSPFTFLHAYVRSISAECGGYTFPSVAYDFDFDNNDYVRAFVDMYVGMGYDTWPSVDQKTLAISMREFALHSCFFVIPMTSTLEDTAGMELIRSGTTLLKCQFSEPVRDEGYEMIVLGEFDSVLTINADRVLSTDGSV